VTIHRSGDPFLEIERVGRLLAGEVIKTAEFIRPDTKVPHLGVASKSLRFKSKSLPSIAEAQKALDLSRAVLEKAQKNGASTNVQKVLQRKIRLLSANLTQAKAVQKGTLKLKDSYDTQVQVLQVGDLVMVAIPGELFVEYALEMRARIRQTFNKSMILVGYANGYIGYLVTPRGMETGGYEASVTFVEPTAGRQLAETAMGLLMELVR